MVAFKLMDMPKHCMACRFLTCRTIGFDYCDLMEQYVDVSLDLEKDRDPHCPLVEIADEEKSI